MVETFAKAYVVKVIEKRGGKLDEHFVDRRGMEPYVMPDHRIIRLPVGHGRIDYDHFHAIAIDQLGLSSWDWDYIVGINSTDL
jgi:hypothetical protein